MRALMTSAGEVTAVATVPWGQCQHMNVGRCHADTHGTERGEEVQHRAVGQPASLEQRRLEPVVRSQLGHVHEHRADRVGDPAAGQVSATPRALWQQQHPPPPREDALGPGHGVQALHRVAVVVALCRLVGSRPRTYSQAAWPCRPACGPSSARRGCRGRRQHRRRSSRRGRASMQERVPGLGTKLAWPIGVVPPVTHRYADTPWPRRRRRSG